MKVVVTTNTYRFSITLAQSEGYTKSLSDFNILVGKAGVDQEVATSEKQNIATGAEIMEETEGEGSSKSVSEKLSSMADRAFGVVRSQILNADDKELNRLYSAAKGRGYDKSLEEFVKEVSEDPRTHVEVDEMSEREQYETNLKEEYISKSKEDYNTEEGVVHDDIKGGYLRELNQGPGRS